MLLYSTDIKKTISQRIHKPSYVVVFKFDTVQYVPFQTSRFQFSGEEELYKALPLSTTNFTLGFDIYHFSFHRKSATQNATSGAVHGEVVTVTARAAFTAMQPMASQTVKMISGRRYKPTTTISWTQICWIVARKLVVKSMALETLRRLIAMVMITQRYNVLSVLMLEYYDFITSFLHSWRIKRHDRMHWPVIHDVYDDGYAKWKQIWQSHRHCQQR